MKLIRERMKQEPDNLLLRLEFLESGGFEPDYVEQIRRAGILYYITPAKDKGENSIGYSTDPVDQSVYQAWLEPYLGDAQPIDLEYFPLTEENINRLKQEILS